MQQQHFIRDDHGVTYRVGTLLGRGLFANTYTVRGEDGQEWVIKTSFTPQDVPPDLSHLVKISRAILDEQWKTLSKLPSPHLLAPVRHFISEDGRYCLVYHRNDSNINQHLAQINTVQDLLRFMTECTIALSHLPGGLCPHGNIHPNNIFWNGKHIQFMDPMTPMLRRHHQVLLEAKGFNKHTPPEYRKNTTRPVDWSPGVYTDTYALCLLLIGQLTRGVENSIVTEGISPLLENNLTQSLELYLQQSPSSNPNFHQRVTHTLVRFLRRGLSHAFAPSPPYRFNSVREFQHRLQSITDLINPTISKVGPILFGGPLGSQTFDQGVEIPFSCSIYTTPMLEDHEDITCGAIVYDLGRDNQRVQNYDLWVEVSRAPDGKLRFQFGIEGLPPGHFQLILGFQINGSLAAPHSNSTEFQIVATPGYTPTSTAVPPKTLQFTSPSTIEQNSQPATPSLVEDTNTSEPDESVESRHPLLKDQNNIGSSRSNANIIIPDVQKERPIMTLPEAEDAHLADVLEPIVVPKLPLSAIPTGEPPSVESNTSHKPSLRVVTESIDTRPKIGALHASPFTIEIESLVLPQTEPSTHVHPLSAVQDEYSIEDSIEDGYTDEFSVVEHTDGFTSNGIPPITQEESSEAYEPETPEPSTVVIADEDVHDVFKDIWQYTISHLKDDPFTVSIVVLVAVIMLLGTLVLFI